jgi:nucleoside-diphosphate-sugar epimerase
MRVAVTGASGFIGRHLVEHLASRGVDVRPIVRPETPLEDAALASAFRGIDVVVHLAGVVSAIDERQFISVNVDATRIVAIATRNAGARLVHISSLAAAGPAPASDPRVESDPPNPVTPYGRSKLAGEDAVKEVDGLRWTILRPGVVYGPRDRAVLPLFRMAAFGVLPLVGNRNSAYTFVHVGDVVRSIDAAIAADAHGETMFVGHPRPVTTFEILDTVRVALGRPVAIVQVPQQLMPFAVGACEFAATIAGRPLPLDRWRYVEMTSNGFTCRVDRLRDRLGVVAAIDLREGFAALADWYRRAGWI